MRTLYLSLLVMLLANSASIGQQSIDFEQLTSGSIFSPPSFLPGSIIDTEEGIPIVLSNFIDENGEEKFLNIRVRTAEDNNFDYAEQNYLQMGGGISLDFTQADSQVKSAYFIYRQGQGLIRNLSVNGDQRSTFDFGDLPPDWGNGISYSHKYLLNQNIGIITITGDINELIISGEGISIDKISFNTDNEISLYPGDTNNDGICNYLDALPIGVGHGKAGPPRENPDSTWTEQSSLLWADEAFPNLTYSDANGDGIISDNDLSLIRDEHLGKTYNSATTVEPRYTEGSNTDDFSIYFKHSTDNPDTIYYEIIPGEPFDFGLDLFLVPGNTQDSIYGISWIWTFDPFIIGTQATAYDFNLNSELGDESDIITLLDTTRINEGIVGCAMVRITGTNTQISETISLGTFNGIIVDLKGFASSDDGLIDVDSVRGIDKLGESIPIYDPNIPVFFDQLTSLKENPFPSKSIILFPNPSIGSINVIIDSKALSAVSGINIYNIDGQRRYENKDITAQMIINTSTWSSGEYFVELIFNQYHPLMYKIIVQH